MKAINRPFTSVVNGTTQFVIPVFQRDYTWSETECEQLWNDILHAATVGSDRGHFLGSIVYVATGDSSAAFTRWLLIDGQQRLTTLTLLLTALRDHIQETDWQGSEDDPTSKRIDAYFLRNVYEEGAREQKLVLRRHDQETLLALIRRSERPKDASDHILENYDFFCKQIPGTDPSIIWCGIGRLAVVDVTLDRQLDDPQLIFESLNHTGIRLTQSDLIRNFILMRLPEKQQTSLYETYWNKIEVLFRGSEGVFDEFARDYVALKVGATKQEKASDIYYAFRRFFPEFQKSMGSLEDTLSDVLRFARYYAAFRFGRDVTSEMARRMASLRHLVDVPAILVMRLYDCRERVGSLTQEEFLSALSLLESYVLRRAVCGYQTRGYWQVFANLAYRIGKEDPLRELKVELACLRENYRFPNDEEFERALFERDIYGLRVCKQLLDTIENYDTKEPSDTSTYSIEHVMPQNERLSTAWRSMLGENWRDVHRIWLNRLGNLTLTGYNSEYRDHSFDDKKTINGGFSESAVRLNKYVREQPVWTASEMENRTRDLAARSLSVWSPLVVSQEQIDTAKRAERRELAFKTDTTKIKMSAEARALFEKLRPKVLEIDNDILELAETNSVSYYGNTFFLEVLPRRYKLTLLLALDFNEIDDPTGLIQDAAEWKFFVYAKHEGGAHLSVSDDATIGAALPFIRQAYTAAAG
jgi:uncharacterized protein with ParB-like and HNH nuclease domain/predicted transport protein